MSAETGGTQLRVHTHESEQHKPEYGPELRDAIVSMAEPFLAKPGAQTLDHSTFDSLFNNPKQFKHEHPVETLINVKDERSNTSFLIERSPSAIDEKGYALSIQWLTLGKEKGSVASGHVSVLYTDGKEPEVVTLKVPDNWAIVENDGFWVQKGGKRCFSANRGDNNLSEGEIKQVLERLATAQVDTKLSEHTAQEVIYDANESDFVLASIKYRDIKESATWRNFAAVVMAELEFRKKEKEWEKFKKQWKRKSKLAS